MPTPSTRSSGTLTRWNDDRGFGFIRPDAGGPDLFVHATAFGRTTLRPAEGQTVHYLTGKGRDGRPQAVDVYAGDSVPARGSSSPARTSPARGSWGGTPRSRQELWSVPAVVLLGLGLSVAWTLPVWLIGWYAALSVLCAAAYALDKRAAVHGGWRTRESTLLMLGLVGGWPGAVVAQQVLRHKTSKVSFRQSFWATVFVNVGALVFLCSPAGDELLSSVTGFLPLR